jgi:hypothetical protein
MVNLLSPGAGSSRDSLLCVVVCTDSQGICYELAVKGLGNETKYDI